MKRTLSLVLALVMLLGTIPVFAAEVDERIAFLEAEGLLKGNTAGDLMLEVELKRQDSVVVLARLLGLEEAALAYEGEFPWEDAKADPFYFGFLAWAYEEGLYKGHSDEKFGFNETITANDFALVLLRALGYGDTEWEDAFEKAEELGLVEGLDVEATDKLLRSNMAIMMYLALETEMAEGGKTLAEELGVVMPTVEMTVTATGKSKLTVTFNKAVSGVTFAVTRGNVIVNTDSAVLAEDGKSAVITTSVPMMSGEYTVTVTGASEEALVGKVTVEAEKVAKINLLSSKAPMVSTAVDGAYKATVKYEVLNQYGEKMNVTATWTSSTGKVLEETTGVLTVYSSATGTSAFVPGTIVYLNGVYTDSSRGYAVVENTQVEIVLPSQESEVVLAGVYNNTTGKMSDLPAGFAAPETNSIYRLLFQVKDQYGNVMTAPDLTKLVFTSSNPLFVTVGSSDGVKTVDSVNYQSVILVAGNNVNAGGTATIQAISTLTGKITSTTIQASAKASLNSFTMSAPAVLVAGNDTKVEIPFVALDQFGNSITKYDDLDGNSRLMLTGNVDFEKQSDGSAKLYYYPQGNSTSQDLLVYITSVVTGGNFSSQMLTIRPDYKPVVISGLSSDVNRTIFNGETVTVADSKLTVLDQYGRAISSSNFASMTNYRIVRTEANTSGGAVELVTGGVKGIAVGSETVTFTLEQNIASVWTTVAGSSLNVSFTTVALSNLSSFAVEDIAKIYKEYDGEFVVYGMTASGGKVVLPTSQFNASATKSVVVTGSALETGAVVFATDVTEVTSVLTVVINATGDIIEKSFVVTNVLPKVDVLQVRVSDVAVTEITTSTSSPITAVSLVAPKLYVKDQYGELATVNVTTGVATFADLTVTAAPTFVISSLDSDTASITNNGLTTATVNGVSVGDSFNLTVFLGGMSVTVKVVVQ